MIPPETAASLAVSSGINVMTNPRRAALAALTALAIGAAASATGAPPAAAQPRAQAPAAKPAPKVKQLFPYWENYLRIPAADRTRFQLAYRLLGANNQPLSDAELFAVDGTRRVPIAVASDGRMSPPPLEFIRSKTAVVDAPAARGRNFNVNLELLASAPAPARELQAADLSATLSQANAGIRKAAGPIGLVAPKMARVVLSGADSGEAVDAQGRRTPLPRVAGESGPYFQPAAMPSASRIVLARAPSKIMLATAAKRKG